MTEVKQRNGEENGKALRRLMGKIGLAMILQTVLFAVLDSLALVVTLELDYCGVSARAVSLVSELLFMAIYLISFLLPTILLRHMLKKEGWEMGEKRENRLPRMTPALLIATIALNFAAAYANTALVSLLVPDLSWTGSILSEGDDALSLILAVISTALIPAVVEELLLRGTVLRAMIPFGRGTAILGSAFLFGLMHGNVLQLFYTTLMGVVLGVIYVRTNSLWCCMLIHFCNNLISVLQEALPHFLEWNTAVRINGILEFSVMLLGGVAVIVLLRSHAERRRPEDRGSFGVLFEPTMDYTRYPMAGRVRVKRFFSPAVIAYTVISVLSMLGTLAMLSLGGM